jgi:diguanylate cyclase (GGDEF)-like protein/PAS domain S-box-containing protein
MPEEDNKAESDAVQEAAQLFAATFEQAAVGIAHVAPDGRWLRVNRKLCEIVGYRRDELLGKTVQEITHPDDLDADLDQVRRMLAKQIETYSMEKRYFRKEGAIVWINLTVSLICTPNGVPDFFVVVVEDISERKTTLLALSESEARFYSLYANMTEGVSLHQLVRDASGQPIDYVILTVNPAYESHTGLRAQDVVGKTASEAYGGIPYLRQYAEVASTGQPLQFEDYFQPLDKTFAISVVSPAKDQFATIFRNISDHIRLELALRQASERFQAIIEASPIPMALNDALNITYLNAAFVRTFGYTQSDIPKIADWWPKAYPDPTYRAQVEREWQTYVDVLLRQGMQAKPLEVCITTRTGGIRNVLVSATPLPDGLNAVHLVTLIDMTERKRAEDQLKTNESLLRTTLESTADGILVVSSDRRIITTNRRFQTLWGIPDDLIRQGDVSQLQPFVGAQLVDPDAFAAEIQRLYDSREEAFTSLRLNNGKVIERYTVPVNLPDGIGRVWSFRDVTDRESALAKVEQEKCLLKTLVRTLPDLVWLKDLDGAYLACNPIFEQFFGAKEAAILGKTDYDFIDRALADAFCKYDRMAITKGAALVNEEWITFASDGHKVLLESTKTPMRDQQGRVTGVLGIGHDITERKRVQDALKRYEEIVQSSDNAIIGETLDGIITHWNRGAEAIFGYRADDVIGKPLTLIFPPALVSEESRILQRIAQGETIEYFETQRVRKDGTLIDVSATVSPIRDSAGNIIGASKIAHDITDRKMAEEAIGNERYQAVLSGTKDGFWLVDLEGRILEVNDAYCAYSGYRREDLLALRVSDLDIEETPGSTQARIAQVQKKGAMIFETTHRRKDGSVWPVEVAINYSPSKGGQMFSFLRDISERKLNEQLGQLRQDLADMVYSDTQERLLQYALDVGERLTESQIGFFHFVEKDQEAVSLQTWSSHTLREMCFAKGDGLHYPVSEAGVWVDCIRQRQPVIHNDYATLPHKKGLPEGHALVIRELVVPVFRDKRIVAVVGVGNKSTDYDEQDVSLLTRLADIAYDFVERKQAEQQIQFMAFNDVLTKLPNRQLFADRLQQAMSLAKRSHKLLAICYLDLDSFKPINDEHGHEVGDQLLIQLAQRLKQELREGDTLARLGGDEFVVLLNELDSILSGEDVVARLLMVIAQPFELLDLRLHVSASIGVTIFPHDNSDPDTLLRHADQAMYQAKENGKNIFRLYDPIQDEKVRTLRKALDEFECALRENQLLLHYQPRIDLKTGELAGVEALVRWQHPQRGLLYPDKFLPLIDSNPLEIALDEWVLRAALDQHLRWREDGLTIAVSVNLNPRHIQQQKFPDYLANLLSSYPENLSRYLELEVLETGAIGDTSGVAEIMDACAALGVQFSLDDFGTGYSSLTHFHRLPISVVKIDQHFVRDMLSDSRDQDIVEGVLRLADALKRPVVAEGVESIEVGLMLVQLGCQYAQGYGISRPMPPEALPAWLLQWHSEGSWHELHQEVRGPTAHYDLNVAIYSHHLWLQKVRSYLQSDLAGEPPHLDADNCQFCRWYKGIGSFRYGHRPSYPFILAKHDETYQLAQTLIDLAKAEGNESALARMESLVKLSSELESLLLALSEN